MILDSSLFLFEKKIILRLKIRKRLRECNYGVFTRHPNEEIEAQKIERIKKPFPDGESYEQTMARVKDFLNDLITKSTYKKIIIIGHRATWYGLEHVIKGLPLEEVITNPWKWQPDWLCGLSLNTEY